MTDKTKTKKKDIECKFILGHDGSITIFSDHIDGVRLFHTLIYTIAKTMCQYMLKEKKRTKAKKK